MLLISIVPGGEPLAKVSVTPSADWKKASAFFKMPIGEHPLYIKYKGKDTIDILSFSFNHINEL